MMLGAALRFTSAILALVGLAGAASAQVSCERYRAELVSLNRAGASIRAYDAAAQRQRNEMARLIGYYRSIGCEQASFFFQPPAECGVIAQRIRAMQANAAELAQQATADPAAIDARRRQLEVAIAKTCDLSSPLYDPPPLQATGGSRLVCVRACDGYFFPLENEPQGRATTRDLCRALCPNAEVSVYRAPRDGAIEQAVSDTGQSYMKLANALRFQRAYDPSCSCRKQGETWAQTLQKAEKMIAHASSDILVTEKKADQLSQASLARPKNGPKRNDKSAKPLPVESASLSGASVGLAEPDTTGSLARGTRERPRVIAPDQVPVPGLPAQ